jgi:HEAT repeat protein
LAEIMTVSILLATAHGAEAEIRTTFLMDEDPEVHQLAPILRFDPRLKSLWLEALNRPEAEMQRMAAGAIGRAQGLGMPGLVEAVPRLEAILSTGESHPVARLAAAQALVQLESKSSASVLADSSRQFGADLRQVAEPALAGWGYLPMRPVWQTRLKDLRVQHRDCILAIRCLATSGDESATESLLALVHDPARGSEVRGEAARAAGSLRTRDLESNAQRLVRQGAGAPLLNRLWAVHLVRHHRGPEAERLLQKLATDAEPSVAVVALTRLLEIDPVLAVPLAAGAMQNLDPKVRRCGAEAYVRVPDPDRVANLARLLDDPHPEVRAYVRESLFVLARDPQLQESVFRSAMEMLAGQSWRGLEQAALLLGALDHEPAAPRMIELLEFARTEVAVAAAWGLKILALPETLPAQLAMAQLRTEQRLSNNPQVPFLDVQTAHLLESFGQMKYFEAEPLLRRYVPKNLIMGEKSRSAAIWSLGMLHAGVPDEGLAAQLMARVSDNAVPPAEFSLVKIMSTVSIGRMLAVSQLRALRSESEAHERASRAGMTFRWALMQLTGEAIPEPDRPVTSRSGWFLEPVLEERN